MTSVSIRNDDINETVVTLSFPCGLEAALHLRPDLRVFDPGAIHSSRTNDPCPSYFPK